jgi:probable phosphoglycerate mutase
VSSTLRRARETADDMGVLMKMTPERDSLISECTPTTERADIMKNTKPEEVALCESNLERAWVKYMVPSPDADRHDVLVSHGDVIRWFVTRAVQGDIKRWLSLDIGNASLTILAVRPDGSVRLVMYSDVGHLPIATQTWSGKGPGWSVPAAPVTAGTK